MQRTRIGGKGEGAMVEKITNKYLLHHRTDKLFFLEKKCREELSQGLQNNFETIGIID